MAESRTAVPRHDPKVVIALRNFAISITVFNILGYTVLGFEQPYFWPFIAVFTGYTVEIGLELIGARVVTRAPRFTGNGVRGVMEFLYPAHITALAMNMLIYVNDRVWALVFGVAVAVGAKWVLRAPVKGKLRHFMNPSNFGITITLVVFYWVNMAPPYQFTENVPDAIRILVPTIIITAGTVLNAALTKRIPLILGWVGGFVIQALLRHFIWDVALVPMTGVAFVLFTNYMITDPATTPSLGRWQFMFGSGVAMTYGVLMLFNVAYTLFFAVCFVCAVRGCYWWYRTWRERQQSQWAKDWHLSPA